MNPPPDQFIKQTINVQPAHGYRLLCRLLSGQAGPLDWDSFTGTDWELIPEMAQAEGVAPLLYSILTHRASGVAGDEIPIPQAVLQDLAQSYYHNAAFNAMLGRELDSALAALTRAGVPVILLKGAALIKTLYPDPAERTMNDLDILVRRGQLRPAVRALQSAGFQRLMENYIRYHVLMLGGQAERVALELHWSLVFNDQRFPALIDWFWGQSRPLDPSNPGVLTFSPTAHLLYLAAHLALQHGSQARLIWYYDLYRLLERDGEQVEWDELLRQASGMGCQAALLGTLEGAQERFGLDGFPDGWLKSLEGAVALQGPHSAGPHPSGGRSVFRKAWRDLSGRDRLGLLRGLLLPRPAYLRWRYQPRPAWLWPVWYVRRWRDITIDG